MSSEWREGYEVGYRKGKWGDERDAYDERQFLRIGYWRARAERAEADADRLIATLRSFTGKFRDAMTTGIVPQSTYDALVALEDALRTHEEAVQARTPTESETA